MNIYLFELKKLFKSLLVWTASIFAVLILLMVFFYPAMMEGKKELVEIFSNYPPEMLRAVGLDLDKLFSYEGFYIFTYMYIGLLAAMMAVSVSLQAFAREKRAKCTDFLLAKPVSRHEIFAAKFMACLTVVLIFNLLYVCLVIWNYWFETAALDFSGTFFLLLISPFLTQLVFVSLGTFYAVFAKKVRTIAGTATAFGFAAFLLSGLEEMLGETWINYFAPLQYFNPSFVFDTGSFDLHLVIMGAAVFTVGMTLAFFRYRNQDIAAM